MIYMEVGQRWLFSIKMNDTKLFHYSGEILKIEGDLIYIFEQYKQTEVFFNRNYIISAEKLGDL